jgi:protein ImuB
MRRVISVWLPSFPTDRWRRSLGCALPADVPLVTAGHDGSRRIIAAADPAAIAQGLRPGMTLAHAQAILPGLRVIEARPRADAKHLTRIAAWCLRYAPMTAPDPPDGIWIDAAGSTHLAGGEMALLQDIVCRLEQDGFAARAAMADTPGAAYAVARHGPPVSVIPPGGQAPTLAGLPIEGLRLPGATIDGLRRLGFRLIGPLAAAARAPMARRFGAEIGCRLDQAHGPMFEPIVPVIPFETIRRRLAFVEPISTAPAFARVISRLTRSVCTRLEAAGLGARRLELRFERVDATTQTIGIGTAQPSRDFSHLGRLLEENIEKIDPGAGVEAMQLVVTLADRLDYRQTSTHSHDRDAGLAALIDRLGNRLGAERVYRVEPVESDVPERAVRRVPPLAPARGAWPVALPRPIRLLTPPQPVFALAKLPDEPPRAFIWKRRRFRIRRADGPERIHGEWWRRDSERLAVRDYYQVEDEHGARFWLYRSGDGVDPETGNLAWFLHGIF